MIQRERPETSDGRRVTRTPEVGEPGLGDLVRDAIDHVRVLLRDGLGLGKLEARRVARELGPRVGWGLLAAAGLGVGAIFALVAIFVGLGAWIASVAIRLAIYALAFLAAGLFGATRLSPGLARPRKDGARTLPHALPPGAAAQEPAHDGALRGTTTDGGPHRLEG